MQPNLTILVIIAQLHQVLNLPQKRSPVSLKISDQHLIHANAVPPVPSKDLRKKKGFNIGYPLPVHHHLLLPTQLHVLPATSNVHHSSVHTDVQHIVTSNGQIPIISQTVSHSSTNINHPSPLIQHTLIPIHDLSVIPLHRAQKFGHSRAEKKSDDHDEQNRFRTFYGGYGTGLYFGGHGAGHGFYASYG